MRVSVNETITRHGELAASVAQDSCCKRFRDGSVTFASGRFSVSWCCVASYVDAVSRPSWDEMDTENMAS
jgi:hypothetical protein